MFSWQLYSYISDDLFLEGALFETQWRHDVSLKITSVIKQKNIISKNVTGLNGLLQSNYCMHWNINVTVIWGWMWWISSQWSKYWFWSYWEWSFLKYGRDRKYEPVEVRSDDDSDRGAGTGGAEGAAAPPVFSVGNCKLLWIKKIYRL